MPATKTPDPTAAHVIAFARRIVASATPILMPIRPAAGCEALDCFHNVRGQVQQHGGRIQFGWSIWEWPRVYLEAEHHAVYAPPGSGPWTDVTPAPDGDTHRVFIADDTAIYDFENEGIRRDNHRMALVDDPLVAQLFDIASAIIEAMNQIPGMGTVRLPADIAYRLTQLAEQKKRLVAQIGMRHTARNERCFCGRGIKFKKCHGR